MHIFALIILTLSAILVLAGFIFSAIIRIWPMRRYDLRQYFPIPSWDDFFLLITLLTGPDPLWHPGRGDLPDPTEDAPASDFHNFPME